MEFTLQASLRCNDLQGPASLSGDDWESRLTDTLQEKDTTYFFAARDSR